MFFAKSLICTTLMQFAILCLAKSNSLNLFSKKEDAIGIFPNSQVLSLYFGMENSSQTIVPNSDKRIKNTKLLELINQSEHKSNKGLARKILRLNDSIATHMINMFDDEEFQTNSKENRTTIKFRNNNRLISKYQNRFEKKKANRVDNVRARLIEAKNENVSLANMQSDAVNFLSKSKFFIIKLEKEAEKYEELFKPYGKKYFNLLKHKLLNTFEEMKSRLCIAVEEQGIDGIKESYYQSFNEMAFKETSGNERIRRRIREKRVMKRICE